MDVHIEECPSCYALMVELARTDSQFQTVSEETRASAPLIPAPRIVIGTEIDQFRIERIIGSGGMGVVYLAHDTQLNRKAAIKVIRTDLLESRTATKRFLKEARTTAKFNHPHIVTIYGIGRFADMHYVALEYLEGSDLGQIMMARRLSVDECIAIALPVAEAICEAHRHGVLHRDLKPANILIPDEGRIRVLDFGLAMDLEPDADDSMGGDDISLDGTPTYMAPEQWRREATSSASDVWAFGMVLHHMLCGRLPYQATATIDLIRSVCSDDPVPNILRSEDVPQALIDLVGRCLKKAPRERIETEGMLSTLQGITQPNTGITATFDALAIEPSPVDSPSVPLPTTVPVRTDTFIGRDAEIQILVDHFVHGDTRLLSIVGTGGMGKTRLVQRFAMEHMDQYPGGTWFCDLSEAHSLEGILSAVSIGLEVPLTDKDPQSRLMDTFRTRGRSLVVLDNFEQVIQHAAATVGVWVSRSPETQFVVTTRCTLGIEGERHFILEPLQHADSVALFAARGATARPGFELDDTNRTTVADIVRALDHMALAIELAAARLQLLSVRELHVRLTNRFQLLRGLGQQAPSRQSTLQATIDWSWALLKPWEQLALAQCSVFNGGFTLRAAEAVLQTHAWAQAPWLLDVIHRLVDHNLLQATEALPNHVRYSMYVSIAEYTKQKMTMPNEVIGDDGQTCTGPEHQRALSRRHATFYAEFGSKDFLDSLNIHGGGTRQRRLHLDFENIGAAIDWTVANDEPALAIQCSLAAMPIYRFAGPILDGIRVAEGPLKAAQTRNEDWVRLLNHRAALAISAGRFDQGLGFFEDALAEARTLNLRGAECIARAAINGQRWVRGDASGALAEYEALVKLCDTSENTQQSIVVKREWGYLLFDLGRMDEALEKWEEALLLAQDLGEKRQEGLVHSNIALCRTFLGHATESLAHSESALLIFRALGNRAAECRLLSNMGMQLSELGRETEAKAHYENCLRIANQIGLRAIAAISLGNLGYLERLSGRVVEGKNIYLEALRIHQELGNTRGEAIAKANLGEFELILGNLEQAQVYLEESIALTDKGSSAGTGAARADLALVFSAQGRHDDARYQLALGEEALRGVWALEYGKLLCKRGHVEHAAGHEEAAAQALGDARAIAEEMNAVPTSELPRAILDLALALGSD